MEWPRTRTVPAQERRTQSRAPYDDLIRLAGKGRIAVRRRRWDHRLRTCRNLHRVVTGRLTPPSYDLPCMPCRPKRDRAPRTANGNGSTSRPRGSYAAHVAIARHAARHAARRSTAKGPNTLVALGLIAIVGVVTLRPRRPSPSEERPASPSPRSITNCRTFVRSETSASPSPAASTTAPARSSWRGSGMSAATSRTTRAPQADPRCHHGDRG